MKRQTQEDEGTGESSRCPPAGPSQIQHSLKNSSLVSALPAAQKPLLFGSPSLLILLELSAVYDTADRGIPLTRLHHTIRLTDTALQWFHSCLTNRTEYVSMGGAKSQTHTFTCGIPQGSILGPIFFTLLMLPLGHVISQSGISFKCYADDSQLYMKMDTHHQLHHHHRLSSHRESGGVEGLDEAQLSAT